MGEERRGKWETDVFPTAKRYRYSLDVSTRDVDDTQKERGASCVLQAARANAPNLLGILLNGAIRTELA